MPLPGTPSDTDTFGMPAGGYQNFDGVAKQDNNTDMDASAGNQLLADVASLTQTGVRAWAIFTTHATTPVLIAHGAMWTETTPPTPSRSSAGVFLMTWPSTVTNRLGTVQSLNFSMGDAKPNQAAFAQVQGAKTAANVVTAYTFSAGVANDIAGTYVLVTAT